MESPHEEEPGRDGAIQSEPKGRRKGKLCIMGMKIPAEQVEGIAEERICAEYVHGSWSSVSSSQVSSPSHIKAKKSL